MTDLHDAVFRGRLDTIRALIDQGAEVNTHQRDILKDAVEHDRENVVDLLISHCNPERAFDSLETAILTRFHRIADILIQS